MRKTLVVFVFVLAAVTSTVASAQSTRRTTSVSAAEQELANAINNARAANGLPPLQIGPRLEHAARDHTQNMLETNIFSHEYVKDGVGYEFWQWVRWYYAGPCSGENIAWGDPSLAPDAAVQMWMASPAHREILLSPSFTRMGVALEAAGGRAVATNDFGC